MYTQGTTGQPGDHQEFRFSATDPEADSVKFQVDWGDGSRWSNSAYVASGTMASLYHQYHDPGEYYIMARAIDSHGNVGAWSQTRWTVENPYNGCSRGGLEHSFTFANYDRDWYTSGATGTWEDLGWGGWKYRWEYWRSDCPSEVNVAHAEFGFGMRGYSSFTPGVQALYIGVNVLGDSRCPAYNQCGVGHEAVIGTTKFLIAKPEASGLQASMVSAAMERRAHHECTRQRVSASAEYAIEMVKKYLPFLSYVNWVPDVSCTYTWDPMSSYEGATGMGMKNMLITSTKELDRGAAVVNIDYSGSQPTKFTLKAYVGTVHEFDAYCNACTANFQSARTWEDGEYYYEVLPRLEVVDPPN